MAHAVLFDGISLENLENWPKWLKLFSALIVLVVTIILGYWVMIREQLIYLDSAQKKELNLKNLFEEKQIQTSNLQAYKSQLLQLKQSLQELLRPLPSESEIPGLLDDISKHGLALGLQFLLFDPLTETSQGFYQDLPISIVVKGDHYSQLALFISEIVGMDRIVTVHDLEIGPVSAIQGNSENYNQSYADQKKLQMVLTAKTYKYLELTNG